MDSIIKKFEFYTKYHVKEIYSIVTAFKGLTGNNAKLASIIKELCIESLCTKNNILYYRLYNSGKCFSHKKSIDSNVLVTLINNYCGYLTKAKNIKLNVSLSRNLRKKRLVLDVDKYIDCIGILVKNSVKNSDFFSSIKVYIREINGKIHTSVTDTGKGIPDPIVKQVFKDIIDAEGLGLGLLILKYHTNCMNCLDISTRQEYLHTLENIKIEYTGINGTCVSFSIPIEECDNESNSSDYNHKEICLIYLDYNYGTDVLIDTIYTLGYIPIRLNSDRELKMIMRSMEPRFIFCKQSNIDAVKDLNPDINIICVTKKNFISDNKVFVINPPIDKEQVVEILYSC